MSTAMADGRARRRPVGHPTESERAGADTAARAAESARRTLLGRRGS
jgi:hypothetical protein